MGCCWNDIYIIQSHSYRLIYIFFNKERKLNKKNRTPLHYAAQNNSKEIGEILISKGADINAIDIISLNMIILFLINII